MEYLGNSANITFDNLVNLWGWGGGSCTQFCSNVTKNTEDAGKILFTPYSKSVAFSALISMTFQLDSQLSLTNSNAELRYRPTYSLATYVK